MTYMLRCSAGNFFQLSQAAPLSGECTAIGEKIKGGRKEEFTKKKTKKTPSLCTITGER
jgi:hypothetical protein